MVTSMFKYKRLFNITWPPTSVYCANRAFVKTFWTILQLFGVLNIRPMAWGLYIVIYLWNFIVLLLNIFLWKWPSRKWRIVRSECITFLALPTCDGLKGRLHAAICQMVRAMQGRSYSRIGRINDTGSPSYGCFNK